MHVVLSSGFLAFAEHAGFLAGLEDAGVKPEAVVGTSSGALAGACLAAGWSASAVYAELTAVAPIWHVRPSWRPWRGLLELSPMVHRLRRLLPETFAALECPLAVGVVGPDGYRLVQEGPLAEAVAASCAIPLVFCPVHLDGEDCVDGAMADRTGLTTWRDAHPSAPVLLHLIESSRAARATDSREQALQVSPDLTVVRSPRSGAQLWSLGDTVTRRDAARQRTRAILEAT